ncbi:MAG TPA: TANFOR domain-containing protein [Bacteroidales bacterium]|nr:TANFOR domain-containing protein [Bacteroidales bacterium]
MTTHTIKQAAARLLLAALAAMMAIGSVKAQDDFLNNRFSLTVNPVMPPYTGKLSDYFNAPGKIGGSILVKGQIDARSCRFYLHVAIINVETQASVRTRKGFVPSNPRTIDLSVIPNNTLIQYGDLQQAMSEQNLEYSGFTREQVTREGLPPGQYMIKLTLFVFPNGWDGFMELGSKYSPPFTISPAMAGAVDPPQIIHPLNGAQIPLEQMQTLQFTWSMPPGASAGTQYKLRIIEVGDPGMNYRDMLRSNAYPAFFETTVTGVTSYLYTLNNPAFKPDMSYAFVVKAIDPFGGKNFKNEGYSEVNVFTQAKKVMSGTSPPPTMPPSFGYPEYNVVTPQFYQISTLKGTLKYKYHDQTKTYPLKNARIKLVTKYIVKYNNGKINEEMTRKEEKRTLNGKDYKDGETIATTHTGDNGEFTFLFQNGDTGEPIDDINCVSNVVAQACPPVRADEMLLADAVGPRGGPNPGENSLASSAAEDGCKLYKGYAIVIEGEHAKYYLDPDQKLDYFFEIKGGETREAGEMISTVRAVRLAITMKRKESQFVDDKWVVHNQEHLGYGGLVAMLYRKLPVSDILGSMLSFTPVFPQNDVTPDKNDDFPLPKGEGMICVGKVELDENGVANFQSVVVTDENNADYQYYLYVGPADPSKATYNYETETPRRIDLNRGERFTYIDSDGSTRIITENIKDLLDERSAYAWSETHTVSYTEEFEVKPPTLRVEVRESEGNKLLDDQKDNVNVYLTEIFHKKIGFTEWDETKTFPMPCVDKGVYLWTCKEMQVDENGVFGPHRKIKVSAKGFETKEIDLEGVLRMGEYRNVPVTLKYGAEFKGTVKDAETGKPVPNAYIEIAGYTDKDKKTDENGKFQIMLRMSETPVKVIVTANGYMTDTLVYIFNQEVNERNIGIFKKARRLKVQVTKQEGPTPAAGVVVTLPDVPESWRRDMDLAAVGRQHQWEKQLPAETYYAFNRGRHPVSGPNATDVLQLPPLGTTLKGLDLGPNAISMLEDAQAASRQMLHVSSKDPIPGHLFVPSYPPYSVYTDQNGSAYLVFEGGDENNDLFEIWVANPSSAKDEAVMMRLKVHIPYGKKARHEHIIMPSGRCMTGTVYRGESNNIPLGSVSVTAHLQIGKVSLPYQLETKTATDGTFTLRNLPIDIPFKLSITTTRPNLIGYEEENYTIPKGDTFHIEGRGTITTCHTDTFHLKYIEGVATDRFMGFPFQSTKFEEQADNSYLVSGKVTLGGNSFFNGQTVDVKDIRMLKTTEKNSDNNYLLTPDNLPVVMDINQLTVELSSEYKALIIDESGLKLQSKPEGKGELRAAVLISGSDELTANFGGYGYRLPPQLYLVQKPGELSTEMPVFSSAETLSAPNVGGGSGYYPSDGVNSTLVYSIDGFEKAAEAQPDKSYFSKTSGLMLQTILKANIATINPANVELDAGVIQISKKGIATVNPKPFTMKMGNWSLSCNKWEITKEGVTIPDAILSTGIDVKIENLKITSTELKTNQATVHLDKLKLFGVKDINIHTTHKGLVYKYLRDGVHGWSLYAVPEIGQTVAASLHNMPGLDPNDKIEFTSVDINNQGESMFVLGPRKFRLFNLVDFEPYSPSYMSVTTSYVKLKGFYDFGIPNYSKPSGAMAYVRSGNNFVFKMLDMDPLFFTHHNVRYDLTSDYNLSDRLFTAKGFMTEPGHLPHIKATLSHTPTETKIDIDNGEKLSMGGDNELANLRGGIRVVNKAWDVLRFEGDVKGMNNMAQNQKMNFEVRGAVMAKGQNIVVDDIPSFPGMTFTYDLPKARLIGTAELKTNIFGFDINGNLMALMDSQGWLFQAGGYLGIPAIGSANFHGLFGNYMDMPPEVSALVGDARCLPNEFKRNLRGFFFTAGITREILPKVHYDFGVVSVTAGVDLGIDARVYMLFGQGTTLGIGLMAEGRAYASGYCPITCTSADAGAVLQLGASSEYNTKLRQFNIDGCASLDLKFSVSQCVPLLVECGPCVTLSLPDFTIGAKLHWDNNNGFSAGITRDMCDQQCK